LARGARLRTRLRLLSQLRPARLIGAAVVIFGYLPLTLLGPGTDLDVGGVYDSGQAILDGDYLVSRTPGAPVFEAVTGVLHAIGGTVLVNLASVAMAVLAAVAVATLLRSEGHPRADWFGLAVLLNPFVWISGTSMVDFMWALGLALAGAHAQLSRRWPWAVALYALAAGCRLSTVFMIGAFLLGDLIGARRDDRKQILFAGLATAVAIAIVFLPPYLSLGWEFLRSDVPSSDLVVQVGRFGVKNWYFFGPIVVVLVAAMVPRLWREIPGRWGESAVLRMALLGAVVGELLYLRFPWKLAHLIPVFVCVVLVLGVTEVFSRRLLAVFLVAQVVLGIVNVNLADPDNPNEATGGTFSPEVVRGPLWTDIACRRDADPDAYRAPGRTDGGDAVGVELRVTWACVVPWSE
jgi:hypothetical protein